MSDDSGYLSLHIFDFFLSLHIFFRFVFQAGGTLAALTVLWVLLKELPVLSCLRYSNTSTLSSNMTTCHSIEQSQLDKSDQEAFWV